MATTNVHYNYNSNNIEDRPLCFKCAVKKMLSATDDESIEIRSTNYEFQKCFMCNNFIRDTINI